MAIEREEMQDSRTTLYDLVQSGESSQILDHLEKLLPAEVALGINRLDQKNQTRLLELIGPEKSADIISKFPGWVLPALLKEFLLRMQRKLWRKWTATNRSLVSGNSRRTMPLFKRSSRRLSWLSINIVLNIVAASVIALYQDTLEKAIVPAVFLPIISDMCGFFFVLSFASLLLPRLTV